jgi:hypothetical protein
MKLGVYRKKPTHVAKIFLSMTKAEKALISHPVRVDVVLEDDKVIIRPGEKYKFSGNGVTHLPSYISRTLATNPSPMRARPVGYNVVSGTFIFNVFELMEVIEKSGEPPKYWKKEPLLNEEDNKSGEVKHFAKPMAPKTIYRIASEVDTYFSDGRYMNGHSDEQIAKELDVSELSVSRVREDCFGSIVADPKQERLDEIQKTLRALQEEMIELRK